MSTPLFTPSHGADLRASLAPYAFPHTGNVSVDRGAHVARANVGPYVPAPWRGKPVFSALDASTPPAVTPLSVASVRTADMPPSYPTPAYFTPLGTPAQDNLLTPAFEIDAILDASDGLSVAEVTDPVVSLTPEPPSLPWIDAFLSSTPALPMRAVDEVPSYTPPASEAPVEDILSTEWPVSAGAAEVPTPSDAWALDEAADQMRALADELREHEGIVSAAGDAARLFDASPSPEPLPAWSDDDMIDIMPLQRERSAAPSRVPTPGPSAAIEPWADRARRAGDEGAEAAARALELLARRVRDGEISLAGYDPRLGDAAVLAAALAALLGVRR